MKIIVDTNVFYNYLFETELTEKAKKILLRKEKLFTSFTVVNELVYIISRKLAEKNYGISSYQKFREFISKNGYGEFKNYRNKVFELFNALNLIILPDYQELSLVLEIMQKYHLLPNDALIAATCKYYGINKIATFDEDFEKVDFLETVKV